MSQAIDRDRDALQLIDYLGNIDLDHAIAADGGVALEALEDVSLPRFRNLVRCWVKRRRMPWPAASVLDEAFASMLTASEDARPLVAWQNVELRRFQNRLYLVKSAGEHDTTRSFAFDPEDTLRIAGGTLTAERVKGRGVRVEDSTELTVGFRRGGERIKLVRSKTLKNLFQERGVPPWLRDRVPLIYREGELIAVAGLPAWEIPATVASGYAASSKEDGWIFQFNMRDDPKS